MKMCEGAIARSEWFPNKLPCIFSRENLKGVKGRSQFWRMKRWGGAIARSECSPINFPASSQGKI
ncbi:hypothetical protein [Cylindrospermopsis raciborskii]|uniref:hypothetical protein n=1 Tax=Cylindrospermopsis raciborskii TaxID=77022 RepID=UPI0013657747|nr:hypothetical protein [Cylindrospermopsis raciborskii]